MREFLAVPAKNPRDTARLEAGPAMVPRLRGPPDHGGPARSAEEGVQSMIQRTIRRLVTLGALAAVLALAAAGPVQARDFSTAYPTWSCLQDLWSQSVSAFWPWSGDPASARETGDAAGLRKAGNGLDPNGSTSTTPTTSQPPCTDCGEQGNGVDPNG